MQPVTGNTRLQSHEDGRPNLIGAVAPQKAADLLGIGRTKLYELIDTGEIRSVKIGRRRLIPLSAIQECLASHEVEA